MVNLEQLVLPLIGVRDLLTGPDLSADKRVFVNRSINLADISWIGFDLDDTLAVYRHERLDTLIVDALIDRMRQQGFPTRLSRMQVDTSFAVRGLVIDTRAGDLLKVTRCGKVVRGYHGHTPLTSAQLHARGRESVCARDSKRYAELTTLWSLCEACVFAALVQESDQAGERVDYQKLFRYLRTCLMQLYVDGDLARGWLSNLAHYVRCDDSLASMLHNLRSSGKKLFLLTNSDRQHVEAVMSLLVGNAMSEYPTWQHYFDVVVMSAQKPGFFSRVDVDGDQSPESRRGLSPLVNSERNMVFQAGNVRALERILGVRGSRVLFIGDHLVEDVEAPQKSSAWRTMMIVPELEQDLRAQLACQHDLRRLASLDEQQRELEDELRSYRLDYKEQERQVDSARLVCNDVLAAAAELERLRVKRSLSQVRRILRQVSSEIAQIEQRYARQCHAVWGSPFRDGLELTSFGNRLRLSACLYSSAVTNLLAYSPAHHFRACRGSLMHDFCFQF